VGFNVGLGSEGAIVVFAEGATVVAFDVGRDVGRGAGGGVDALCPLRSQIQSQNRMVAREELPKDFAI
jgi:hypothetical protein